VTLSGKLPLPMLTLYLVAFLFLLQVCAKFDFSDETLEERLNKIFIYPKNNQITLSFKRAVPEHTELQCVQVDGIDGMHYRSCRVKNACFLINPLRWLYLSPPLNAKDKQDYEVDVGGPPGFIKSPLIASASQNSQDALGDDGAVIFVDNPTMIYSRFLSHNFFHRLHDDLLPLILQMAAHDELHGKADLQRYVLWLDNSPVDAANDLYSILGEPIKISQFDEVVLGPKLKPKVVCFTNAFVGAPKKSMWYRSNFEAVGYRPEDMFPQNVIGKNLVTLTKWLKIRWSIPLYENFSASVLYSSLLSGVESVYPLTIPKLKISVIKREQYRKIRNETALIEALKKAFPTIEIAFLVEEYFGKSVELIRQASESFAIIGVHGALLTNALFMPKGSMVFEIMPYAVSADLIGYYKTLANLPHLGLHYRSMMSVGGDESGPWDEAHLSCLDVLPPSYQQGVKSNTLLPNFQCCYNVFWRYRAGQDVEADIPLVIQSLKDMMLDELNKH